MARRKKEEVAVPNPIPEPPRIPKPKVGVLREFYRDYIAVDTAHRIDALIKIKDFYEENKLWLVTNTQLDREALIKKLERIDEVKKLEERPGTIGEREASLVTIIRTYEQIGTGPEFEPPKVQDAVTLLDSKMPALKQEQDKLERLTGETLAVLFAALKPERHGQPIKYVVAPHAAEPYKMDRDLLALAINKKEALELVALTKSRGLYFAALRLLPITAREEAMEIQETLNPDDPSNPSYKFVAPMSAIAVAMLRQMENFGNHSAGLVDIKAVKNTAAFTGPVVTSTMTEPTPVAAGPAKPRIQRQSGSTNGHKPSSGMVGHNYRREKGIGVIFLEFEKDAKDGKTVFKKYDYLNSLPGVKPGSAKGRCTDMRRHGPLSADRADKRVWDMKQMEDGASFRFI